MDQNNPNEEATGAQPPAESGSGDAAAWNQAPSQDQAQPAAGGGQDAAAEYAAWSADASYQQQPAQPAAQQPGVDPDTQAYAAPEPQSATYSEQPAAGQQQYAQQQYQQPQPDQQAQQQAYDQQAYAQQQQQYAQQQYQQPQPDQQAQQQAYDQQAYAQQQQSQQPQYYDQSAYGQQQQSQQPQYYDQSAYGQQPGYYDQSAYGQQQYPQQQGYQQATPYAYAQPGQDQWAGQAEAGGYNRSFMAVLSGWVLLTWGMVFGIIGAIVLWLNTVTDLIPSGVVLSQDVLDLAAKADDQIIATGGIALIIGLMHLIAAVGIWAHRRWGRAFGIVIGFLGILAGLGVITISAGFEAMDVGLNEAIKGEESSLAASLLVLGSYLLVFLGMFVGRRQFKKKGVEG